MTRPEISDRTNWQQQIDALRIREKAHTREGDAIAAARRRLPMVEVDSRMEFDSESGPIQLIEAFDGRTQLFAATHMWRDGLPAADQCEGCTLFNGGVAELGYLHSRDVTFAVFCAGPIQESLRYRDFMGWEMPWYSVPEKTRDDFLMGRSFGMKTCYLRDGDRVFETYWTTGRGVEIMTPSYPMLDMTPFGRRETWEESPDGWPQEFVADGSQMRSNGRPIAQWSRIADGEDDDLTGNSATSTDLGTGTAGACCSSPEITRTDGPNHRTAIGGIIGTTLPPDWLS